MAALIVAPNRKKYQCYLKEEHRQIILNWLDAHSPDDWHGFADQYNWDYGHDILGIICEQSECDRATAQLVFMRSDASHFTYDQDSYTRGQEPGCLFQLAMDIVERWKRSFYTRAEIGFSEWDIKDWDCEIGIYQRNFVEVWDRDPRLKLPDDFLQPPTGKPFDRAPYLRLYETLPMIQ